MKKILYLSSFILFATALNAQSLVFSWNGTFFVDPPAPPAGVDIDSVYFYVENTGLVDIYLTGFGPSRLYFQNANMLLTGETNGTNPNYTHSSIAVANGFSGAASTATENLTLNNIVYDRFVGVSPAILVPNQPGLLLEGEGGTGIVKMGTYRFRVEANMGGTGCFVTAPFQAFSTYTASLTPIWDFDLEVAVPATGPCSAGCAMVYSDQFVNPGGGQCCISCGPLGESALPLDLIKFSARRFEDRSTNILWQTANEENISHFEILRSTDAINWEMIGKASAHGTSQNVYNYATVDYDVYDGRSARAVFYYRLKIVDNDDSFAYSNIQVVSFNAETGVFHAYIYPNPSSDEVTVELNYADDSAPVRDLLIYNNLGQLVYSQEVADGQEVVYLNHATTGLVAGSYVLELRDVNNNPVSQDKIVVQR